MRFVPVALIVAGIGAMAALVIHFGAGAVAGALVAVGLLGFTAVTAIHVLLIALMGLGWAALLPHIRIWVTVWGRFVRDAGSEVLPLSQVGGYVLGTRAVALAGVPATQGAASTIVDVTLEFVSQLAYVALGLIWLLHLEARGIAPGFVVLGLAVSGSLAVAFIVVQRRGIRFIDRIAQHLGQGWAARTATGAAALHQALDAIYRRRGGICLSFLLHLACWIASASEIFVALWFAGRPVPFGSAMVIESLVYAIRSTAFYVPNSVGVQEGAYVLLGGAFGLSPEMALALSLLKRARDLTIGLPVIGLWQAVESGRIWRRLARKSGAPLTEQE
ncbi:MAG: flippase-like domain-containing protein [Alphaproteobacteria bacterium]|nr:flippase-like domain-containing protein [Alphaproteobacteria bacterium]MBV9554265.1 flippase-like domain-containing protein [Alphaproteobacteria bacterium]